MGQRFRLRQDFDISGYSAPIQVILTALKTYGMFLADNGSAWYLSGVPDERWDNDMLRELKQLQGSDFEAIDESSLMADANSARIAGTSDGPTDTMVPNGTISDTRRPVFSWPATSGATWYQLWFELNGAWYWNLWVQGSTTWSPAAWDFDYGSYTWWVQPWGEAIGYGSWSAGVSFSIEGDGTPPEASYPTTPVGQTDTNQPQFTWEEVEGATWYYIWINRNGDYYWSEWFQGVTTHTWTHWSFDEGNYGWWVQTWNDYGYGPWSQGRIFLVR